MSNKVTRRRFLEMSAGAVGVTILASCQPSAPTQAPAAPTQAGAATAAPKGPAPKVHLWSNMVALVRPEGSDPEALEMVKNYIVEKVGVEPVANIPPAGTAGAEKLNLMLGSKTEELDIFVEEWSTYKDAVLTINELLDQYGQDIKKKFPKDYWAMVTDSEGKIWGVPRLAPSLHVTPTWFRTDWLKELNLPMPSTFDQMEQTMEAFRQKYPDCVLLTNSLKDFRYATVGGFTQYGYSNWFDTKDNLLKPPELQPDYKDWVAKMAEWYKKGWIFKESFATHDDAEVAKGGRVAIFAGWYSRVTIWFQRIIDAVPGMNFEFNPQGITGPKGLLNTFEPGGGRAFMITRKCKHPDAAMKFLNWQFADIENCLTAHMGVKGVHWDWDEEANKVYGKKYFVKRLVTPETPGAKVYAGEFMASTGPITEPYYGFSDKEWKKHYEYIRDYCFNFSVGKQRVDWLVPYDGAIIKQKVPGLNDISRLLDEETTKFITGARPLSEWGAFVDQLHKAGLKDWMAAHTEQYLKFTQK